MAQCSPSAKWGSWKVHTGWNNADHDVDGLGNYIQIIAGQGRVWGLEGQISPMLHTRSYESPSQQSLLLCKRIHRTNAPRGCNGPAAL